MVYEKKQYLRFINRSNLSISGLFNTETISKAKDSIIGLFSFFSNSKNISKQMLSVLSILLILSCVSSFNFPWHSEDSSYISSASALDLQTVDYKFNEYSYLSSNGYTNIPDPKEKYAVQTYDIEAGDTISDIAEKFDIKTVTVLGANDKGYGEIIKPGEKLDILPVDGLLYEVKKGDSFASISKKYDVSEKVIKRVNSKDVDYVLQVGDELLIPGVEYALPEVSRSSSVYYAGRGSFVPKKKTYSTLKGGRLLMPATGIITQSYHAGHQAIDIANKIGTTLFAAESGTVKLVSVGSYGHGYGNYVIIDHGDGLETLYAHMQNVYVTVGQSVVRGESIGAMGSTGRSTGPHVHFEVRDSKQGYKMNPLNYL